MRPEPSRAPRPGGRTRFWMGLTVVGAALAPAGPAATWAQARARGDLTGTWASVSADPWQGKGAALVVLMTLWEDGTVQIRETENGRPRATALDRSQWRSWTLAGDTLRFRDARGRPSAGLKVARRGRKLFLGWHPEAAGYVTKTTEAGAFTCTPEIYRRVDAATRPAAMRPAPPPALPALVGRWVIDPYPAGKGPPDTAGYRGDTLTIRADSTWTLVEAGLFMGRQAGWQMRQTSGKLHLLPDQWLGLEVLDERMRIDAFEFRALKIAPRGSGQFVDARTCEDRVYTRVKP